MINMDLNDKCKWDICCNNLKKPNIFQINVESLYQHLKPYKRDDISVLENLYISDDAKIIRDEPNAGGGSVVSEVLCFEILQRIFNVRLFHPEMSIKYCHSGSKKTDFSIIIDSGQCVGVSVTRAMKFPGDHFFTEEDAKKLLMKKLEGINHSSQNVIRSHGWKRQILFIWTRSKRIATMLKKCYKMLKSQLRSNTIVIIAVTSKCDYIY